MRTFRLPFILVAFLLDQQLLLAQVQPRTPIDTTHTPGDGTNQFIITTSGSYYLTGNVGGTSGKNGIAIAADNVTVDLNGFSLLGTAGSLSGAVVSGARQNIVIYNGTARGWGGSGIDAGGATNAQLTRLQVSANGRAGLIAGASTIVRDCIAAGNTGDGIRVTEGQLAFKTTTPHRTRAPA